jgi:type IV pilus assembly protein PilC
MGKYYYSGVTRQRENVSGAVEAKDELEARMKLRAMQIRPTKLSERRAQAMDLNALGNIALGSPIDLKGIMVFTRQFSSLIDSGIPVVQCLDILWQQEQRKAFKTILGALKKDIETGAGLAESLAKHPRVFNEFFVRIVEAGEVSGTLDKALRRIGIQLEKLGRIRAKVIGALTYPLITLVVAIAVLIFLLVKVIPEVGKLYGDNNAQLPELTMQVLAVSAWFQDNYLYVVGAMGFVGFGLTVAYRVPELREVLDRVVVKVPLFGDLIKKSTIARLARTLSTLLSSGVPLLTAFEICTKLVENRALQAIIRKTAKMVQEGKNIAQGLAVGGSLFPPMVIHMVNIGEVTGKLDDMLGKVADIFEDEVDDAIGNLTGLLQPAMIVGVGIVIAFLLTA